MADSARRRVSSRGKPERVETGFDVFKHRQPGEEGEGLEHDRNSFGGPRERRPAVNDVAGGRLDEPAGYAQKRRFSRAGAAEKTENLPIAHGHVDVRQHRQRLAGRLGENHADFAQIDVRAVCISDHFFPSIEPRAAFGKGIERPPQQTVHGHDEHRHDRDTKRNPRIVASLVIRAM